MPRYHCPHCAILLREGENRLLCSLCSRSYPIVNGIPHFSANQTYYGEIPKEDLVPLLVMMQTKNFQECLNELPEQDNKLFDYLFNQTRINGLHTIEAMQDDIVLDLGAGYGTHSLYLATKCQRVDALDWVEEKMNFVQCIALEKGLKNLNVVKADSKNLPYGNETFSKIIMNGILQWLPLDYCYSSPRRAQLNVLRKCHDLLKQGGEVYIGIENRRWYGYYQGMPDPHEKKLHYVTVLPRILAQIVSLLNRGKRYRTYIYSMQGYRRLLSKAGFKKVKFYGAFPNYNMPFNVIPVEQIQNYLLANITSSNETVQAIKRLMIRLGLEEFFVHSYIIVARKGHIC